MSLIKSIMHQLGLSGDPAKNFTLSVPAAPDGTMKLARGNAGATTQDIMTVDAAGSVSFPRAIGVIGGIDNQAGPINIGQQSAQVSHSLALIASGQGSVIQGVFVAGTYAALRFTIAAAGLPGTFFEMQNNGIGYAPVGWQISSDRRLKENIEPIADALNKIKALEGCTFARIGVDGVRYAGFIAQDVQSVLPEAVSTAGNDMLALDSMGVLALAVQAIKELSAKVEALENKQ